ncbi:MAG: nuclear transport factor 2 family protein [Myxococcota bacterium]
MDVERLTDEFFAAIERRDWDDVERRIHPEARAMQNVVGQDVDARGLLRSMRGLVASLGDIAYENPRRVVGSDAVVEQHDVRMTRKDGKDVVIDVCILLRFDAEGRIVRLDEYFDSAAAAALA